MSQKTNAQNDGFIDLSDDAGKKKTFRKLLLGLIATFIASFATGIFGELPQSVQIALDLESEMVAPWQRTFAFLVVLTLLGVLVWAMYELWNFRESGLPKLFLVAFAPLFLVDTAPSVASPFSDYLNCVSCVLMGMILFMGWASPEIFQAQSQNQEKPKK